MKDKHLPRAFEQRQEEQKINLLSILLRTIGSLIAVMIFWEFVGEEFFNLAVFWHHIASILIAVTIGLVATYTGLIKQRRLYQKNIITITERQQVEVDLQLNEDKYRKLTENLPDIVARFDSSLRHIYVNPAIEKVTGLPPAAYIGKTNMELGMPEEMCTLWNENLGQVFRTAEFRKFDFSFPAKEGLRHFSSWVVPELSEDGKVNTILTIAREITERIQAEEAIRESVNYLNRVINHIGDPIFVKDQHLRLVLVNEAYCSLTGKTSEEIIGKTGFEYLPEEEMAVFWDKDILVLETGEENLNEENLTDGEGIVHTVLTKKTQVIDNAGNKQLIGVIRDITERKQAEILLKEKVEELSRMATVIRDSNDAVIMHDLDGKIMAWNKGAKETYGYTESEALGKNIREIVAESDREAAVDLMEKIKLGEIIKSFELKRITRDGVILDVWLTTTLLTDEKGKPVAIATTERNITELKQAERELIASKEKAEESDHLKTALLNNMSHEIRTPMNAIIGFSRLMREAVGDEKNDYAEIIQNSADQLLALIDHVIQISRLKSEKVPVICTSFKPAGLIMDVYRIFNLPDLHRGLEIKMNVPDEYKDLIIQSDYLKIKQVLTSLASNAVKYTLQGSVEIGFDIHDKKVQFYVKDTGMGIPEHEKGQIFGTFYRGEQAISLAIRGIGLGLCIAKELVGLLKGEIGVTSEPNKGSRFYFTLPLREVKQNIPERELRPANRRNLMDISILIAEDEPVNYQYLEILLKGKVKNVDHALNGREAVKMVSENNYNLILMDMKMPVMGGIEATKILKQKFPGIPIIAQTAFTLTEERVNAMQAGCDDFLSKPIKKEDLMEIINKYR